MANLKRGNDWFRAAAAGRFPLTACRATVGLAVLLLFAGPGWAWGPHTEITAAALAVLPEKDKVQTYLGDDWQRLARDYVWMGDWREAVRPDHYADDYLLFPSSPVHVSHLLPDVRRTYAPFFKRALQAIRTESPQNAARWVGSLLHFVQDSGSPPHTIGLTGPLHTKMERWVDESRISLGDYKPRLLGKTDAEALKGFQERMEELIDYSKLRAAKLKPILENLEERADQPLELESALETARVTADVVHTLFTLGLARPAEAGAALEGKLDCPPPRGYAAVPAKVVLEGTEYATTTDADGGYRFRCLPAGKYTLTILATGRLPERVAGVELETGKTTRVEPRLAPDPVAGNLVRNPTFQLRWIRKEAPDGWGRDPVKEGRWASALLRVPVGQKCSVCIEFVAGKQVPVALRWRSNPADANDSREVALANAREGRLATEVAPDEKLKPFEKGVLFLEVLVQTDRSLEEICKHVAVRYVD